MNDQDRQAFENRDKLTAIFNDACNDYDIENGLTKTGDWQDERAEIVAYAIQRGYDLGWDCRDAQHAEVMREVGEVLEEIEDFIRIAHVHCDDNPIFGLGDSDLYTRRFYAADAAAARLREKVQNTQFYYA